MSKSDQPPSTDDIPPLPFKNRSFLAFLLTQALGAFNDNVFKQLVLLLGVGYLMLGVEYQAVVQSLFALPFLLFSGIAGDLADKFSKGRMMVACKIAEIIIALLGVGAFLTMTYTSFLIQQVPLYLWLLAGVTFLLGTQSAFFGPAKYGGLPELVRLDDLSQATGLTQMTTFLAIILGVAVAGLLADFLVGKMYLAGIITVGIAVFGTLSSLAIAKHPAADPERRLNRHSFISVLKTLAEVFQQDKLMFRIMLIYSWFWFVGGVALTAINAFGRFQLGLNNFETSLMVAVTSLGIAAGSLIVGRLSAGKIRLGLIKPAISVLILCLLTLSLLPVHQPQTEEFVLFQQLKNTPELLEQIQIFPTATFNIQLIAFALCFLLGVASGFYSVPLLAFIQARPPVKDKGRVFAAVNWLNWIFILLSALFYGLGFRFLNQQANLLFAALAGLTLLIALIFLPDLFKRLKYEAADYIYSTQHTKR
ncbi:MFS transporter [methane-oxidizing endosymbiont of Gigantopelta aegis]|uniref:MFS transporter n=1 Tax=methane-oxidizing endosymbiont of Gigantopelta aegis TaxID=2794938 RepID=UPI0018DC5ECB|nr:MFS transporter [methane-oxidizing endosymbiont of Gigantopelta aegis]